MTRRWRSTAVAFVVACAWAAVGCGIEPQEAATRMPDVSLPPEAGAGDSEPRSRRAKVFLVRDGGLVGVERDVRASPAVVVESLLSGPTEEELAAGVRSAIPPETKVRSVAVADGDASIDLSEEFVAVSGREHQLAIAQLVYTLTELDGVVGVRFAIEGQPAEVPRSDGTLSNTALTRSDFASIGDPEPAG